MSQGLGLGTVKTSTGTNKMRKTNALYLKTQRLITETHRDTEGYTNTHTQRHTHPDTHRETQRNTHRDTQ